jgi:outer membrane biosynthesis protein TonB
MKNNKALIFAGVSFAFVVIFIIGAYIKLYFMPQEDNTVLANNDVEEVNTDAEDDSDFIVPDIIDRSEDNISEEDIQTQEDNNTDEKLNKQIQPEPNQQAKVTKSYPDAMEQPAKPIPKPVDPPKDNNVVITPDVVTNSTKPNKPTKPKVIKTNKDNDKEVHGGTGDDGVIRDVNGNKIDFLKPATNIEETDSSELEGQFEMGMGDKF